MKLYQLATGDMMEFVFVVAPDPTSATTMAKQKTQTEGKMYEFTEDEIIKEIPVSPRASVGVWEYINCTQLV